MNFSDQRTAHSISPFQRENSYKRVSKFTKNADQSDIFKSELRQAIVVEEEYRYQVEMLKKQNDELQKQSVEQQRLYQHLELEFQKVSSQFQLIQEKYITLENYARQFSNIKEMYNQEKNRNAHLIEQLQNEKRQISEIMMKGSKLSDQCRKLDLENQELQQLNESLQMQKTQLKKLVDTQERYQEQKENELQMLQTQYNRLTSVHQQKEFEMQDYLQQNEHHFQNEVGQFQNQIELLANQIEMLNNLIQSQEKELAKNKGFQEKQYEEYQSLQNEYNDLIDSLNKLNSEKMKIQLENDKLKEDLDILSEQVEELENLNQQMKVDLQSEKANNEELQQNIVSLEKLAFKYKSQYDQLCDQNAQQKMTELIELSSPPSYETRSNKITSQLKKITNYSTQDEPIKSFNLPYHNTNDKMHQISYDMSKISPKSQQQVKGFHSFNFSDKDTKRGLINSIYSLNRSITPSSITIRETVNNRQSITSQFENKENLNQSNALQKLQKKYLTLRNRISQT